MAKNLPKTLKVISLKKPRDLEWMVNQRNRAQSLLHDTYELLSTYNSRRQRHECHPEIEAVFLLQVGIVFSLWRAVFLAVPAGARTMRAALKNGEEFLEKVVERNAVAFNDEFNMRNWTAGYYLNSARYRLSAMGPLLVGFELVIHEMPDLELKNPEFWHDQMWWEKACVTSERVNKMLREQISS